MYYMNNCSRVKTFGATSSIIGKIGDAYEINYKNKTRP